MLPETETKTIFSIGYSRNRSVILFTILSRKFRYITCTDLNTDLNDIAVRMYPTNETANLNSINYLLNGIQKQTLHGSAHHIYSWEIAVYDSVKKPEENKIGALSLNQRKEKV